MSEQPDRAALEQELARVRRELSKVRHDHSILLGQMIMRDTRVDLDALKKIPATTPPVMWCVFGPTWALPGGLFYKRKYAIDYAEDVLGMPWRKIKTLGYSCEKVSMAPIAWSK